eukprot:Lithocolla_globosa_v1_NODE_407_length_4133_cov_91.104463.p4 type:complete len:133 gc:universal NODE_407_length_4133_cov_91.104463:2760-3158(+)
MCRHLDQQRIKVGRDGHSCRRGRVQTDARSTWATVDLQFAGIRTEFALRILSGDANLDGHSMLSNLALLQVQIGQTHSRSNTNLRLDNIDPSNLLCNGVFNLHTRVNFNEVIGIFRHQKLHSTGIAVINLTG